MAGVDWHGLSFEAIDPRLCTACGTCIAACPVDALAWRPSDNREGIDLDREACVNCGLCYAVCPPENSQGAALPGPADPYLGPYLSLSRAHAADPAVRQAGSAGGAATALLLSALEQGLVDGALLVVASEDNPSRSRVMVARTAEEIRAAAQSRYCLAPVNALLNQLPRRGERLAVVALPCQAHGLRLAQALNLAIARSVTLVIGLFCGFNLNYAGTLHLLRRLGLRPDQVSHLEYRGGPWPGGFRARAHDGREGFIPKHQYAYVHLMYAPEGCWYCPDLTAEHADVSVGDYWSGGAESYSLVVGRTAAGQALLDGAVARGQIIAEAIAYDEVWASHHHLLVYKKKGVQVRRRLAGRKAAQGYELPALAARDWPGSALFYGLIRLCSSRAGRWAIDRLPPGLIGQLSAGGRDLFRRPG